MSTRITLIAVGYSLTNINKVNVRASTSIQLHLGKFIIYTEGAKLTPIRKHFLYKHRHYGIIKDQLF